MSRDIGQSVSLVTGKLLEKQPLSGVNIVTTENFTLIIKKRRTFFKPNCDTILVL